MDAGLLKKYLLLCLEKWFSLSGRLLLMLTWPLVAAAGENNQIKVPVWSGGEKLNVNRARGWIHMNEWGSEKQLKQQVEGEEWVLSVYDYSNWLREDRNWTAVQQRCRAEDDTKTRGEGKWKIFFTFCCMLTKTKCAKMLRGFYRQKGCFKKGLLADITLHCAAVKSQRHLRRIESDGKNEVPWQATVRNLPLWLE